jgi:hypothetical protein
MLQLGHLEVCGRRAMAPGDTKYVRDDLPLSRLVLSRCVAVESSINICMQ